MEKILDFKNSNEYEKIEEAGNIIKNGGLVLFPTETVYGIGANGLDENAVRKIFIAKGRKQDNPLILHISDYEMLKEISKNINETEQKLIEAFWPGPFTIILERTEKVPNIVTGGLDTVGIRMPENTIAQKLIKYSGVPIAAPSANISGKPSGTRLEDIFEELKEKVDYIIDGGECKIGLESTVVRVIDNIPHILRPGKITEKQIKNVVGNVVVDEHILNKIDVQEEVLSPGMKYRHYAPKTECVLIYSKDNEKMIDTINEEIKKYKKVLVIATDKNVLKYNCENILKMGNNLEEISKNIFKILRQVDNYKVDKVIIEGVEKEGLGLAIMNRLIRACEYNFVEI